MSSGAGYALDRRQAQAFSAASLMAVSGPLPLFLAGTLALELQRDLGMTTAQIGLASSLFYLGSGLLSTTSGAFVQRMGWRAGLRIAATAAIVSSVAIVLAANSVAWFIGLMLIGCLAHAFSGPAGNLAVATELPPQRLGFFFGLKQSANPVAGILAGAAVPLVAIYAGWRLAFLIGALFPIGVLIATLGVAVQPVSPPSPRSKIKDQDAATLEPVSTRRSLNSGLRKNLPVLVLALGASFATASVAALAAYTVLSAVDAGVSQASAGVYVMAASLGGLLIRLVGGWWVDRTRLSPLPLVALMLATGVVAHLSLAAGQAELVLPAMMLAYAAGWGWPGLFMYSIAYHFGSATARVTGRMQSGMMLGGVVGPILFAALQHRWGYGAGWLSAAVLCGMGAVLVFTASLLLRREAEEEAQTNVPAIGRDLLTSTPLTGKENDDGEAV